MKKTSSQEIPVHSVLQVKVKPNSRKESVELQEDGSYLVRVNAPPVEGKANCRVIELLSLYLNKPKSRIELLSGEKGRIKRFRLI